MERKNKHYPFRICFFLLLVALTSGSGWSQTLDECQSMAEQNYPLIRRYALLEHTTRLTLEEISKGWLPTITATVQGNYQSSVSTLPDALASMMRAQGTEYDGLGRFQYRAGVDIMQPIYDGGHINGQRKVAKAEGEVQKAQNETNLYQLRQRINDLYFGLLLVEDRLQMNADLQELYRTNEAKLQAMYNHGTASLADLNIVKAERISVNQQRTELEAQRKSLVQLLSAFIGKPVGTLIRPSLPAIDTKEVHHPQLKLIDNQQLLIRAQQSLLRSRVLPRLSVFASGYYGYTGYDMFHDMMHRTPTLNGMVGLRLTWSPSNFFTQKVERQKLETQSQLMENQRETFLFNNHISQIEKDNIIEKYRLMTKEDEQIVELRRQVRQAAESKLSHGIISSHDLVREINSENQALIQQSLHQVELLKSLYDLKIILNN